MSAEQIRHEELFLKKFGFIEENFDLAKQLVEVLTEQAAALYDFKTKTLYLGTWAAEELQEPALVHELVHALEDQHFNLTKFSKKSKGADQDLARSAVIEGQASWVMIEHSLRRSGRSLMENSLLAAAAAGSSRFEAERYPVYSGLPLVHQGSSAFPLHRGPHFPPGGDGKIWQRGVYPCVPPATDIFSANPTARSLLRAAKTHKTESSHDQPFASVQENLPR